MEKSRAIITKVLIFQMLVLLFSGCSLTKGLKDEDMVYMGAKVKVIDKKNAASVQQFYEINDALPNKYTKPGIANINVGLYNLFKETKETGIKHWVKYKLGNKPVVFENQMIGNTKAQLTYYLNGKGFFDHEVACDTSSSGRKINMTCTVELNERYRIDSVIFPVDSTYISLNLDDKLQRAILTEGSYYNRDRLDYERSRLTRLAGDIGYAEFSVDNVFYYVDTAKGNHKADIYLRILPPSSGGNHIRYTLDTIHIFPNYSLIDTFSNPLTEAPISGTIKIFESDHYLNHDLINHVLLENTGSYYNRTNEQKTVNRFQDLGLFRFINVKNLPNPNGGPGHMIQQILLSPEKIQNISAEAELNNRSGNFFGTGASVKYRHKNLFGHAEQFNVSLSGQLETQIGTGLSLVNSSDITGSTEIIFPRLIVPFFKIREGKTYIPKTDIKTNYTYQRRIQYYTLSSLVFKYGFLWRETATKYHELYPLVVNKLGVNDKTEEFQRLLDNDPRLQSSFENTLITGIQYNFTYSDQINLRDRNHFYLKNETETSGNLFNLVLRGDAENPKSIAGINYAQFFKNTVDVRKYIPFQRSDLAMRVLLGTAFSYGNSKELPYIKQYFIGGSNSVRAFRLRGLGPGSYVPEDNQSGGIGNQFVDQTGDLKIEMSAEYRFPIYRFFKGAVFADAGNVWLLRSTDKPEGVFGFSDFYKELGIGAGFGLRLDFNFFLLRLDLATPFRAPMRGSGFQWVIDDINPVDKSWRREYLRYNLGIGYPF
ncbi:MAG: BamA/TamA family outer membrane protein [Saprospiraceae bacterium]|nr:BamA/TamA family outer membrane protein [Saprospiraceae bacterium]